MKYRDLHRYLMARNYQIIRESGHHIYSNGHYSIAVPHCKEVAIGTLRDVFKQLYRNDINTANYQMRKALGKVA